MNGTKKIHITTLGCSKNIYDSEILMGQLKRNRVALTENPGDADIIIVNTCGFIQPAKEESIDAIMEAVSLKKKKPGIKVLASGCLSRRYPEELRKQIPEVDEYFGTEDYQQILKYLGLPVQSREYLYQNRFISTKPHYAYLKISEGCNHKCSFCAIPFIRGTHRSRDFNEIIGEARLLADTGIKEVILIAQDSTSYGIDLYKKQRIVDLIREIEKIPGINWIRLHYAYPTTFPMELIELMQQSDKLVHYIDLPLQHISDRMLQKMRRGGHSRSIRDILYRLRSEIPDVAIRTTFIVGHPGETEADFAQLRAFIREFQFDRMGAFIYSPEEGTASFHSRRIPRYIAQKRYAELMEIQQPISKRKNEEKIGNVLPVLIDEVSLNKRVAVGRTYADSPEIDNEVVINNSPSSLQPGQFYPVKITEAYEYELFGQILEDQ